MLGFKLAFFLSLDLALNLGPVDVFLVSDSGINASCKTPGMFHDDGLLDPALSTRYIENSLSIDSAQMKLMQGSARKHNITVALGLSENNHNSLYISQCIIGDGGHIAMRRRKLMPTHMERTIFGNCSENSLDNVVTTSWATRDSWRAGSTCSRR